MLENKRPPNTLQPQEVSLLLDRSPDGIFICNSQGQYIYANPAVTEILGYTHEELLQLNIKDVVHPEDLQKTPLRLFSSQQSQTMRMEHRLLRKDGSVVMTERSSHILPDGNVVSFVRDVSRRHRIEQAIRQERDRAQSYLDLAGVMFIALDCSGIVTMANARACHVLGYDESEIIGKFWFEHFVPEPYLNKAWNSFQTRIHHQHPEEFTQYSESAVITRDGRIRQMLWHNALLRDEQGQVIGLLGSGEDITEKLQVEQAELARAAAEASNLAKSEFLAMMSHEIRTPMNAVVGIASLLLHSSLPPEQKEYIETLHGAAQTLQDLLNDILDFSKIEAGKLDMEHAPFHVRHTIETVSELLAEKAHRKGLELSVWVDPNLSVEAKGDVGRLRQVLTNLVDNAIKFTETGEILISAEPLERRDDEWLIRFEVRDTGIGMNQHQQNIAFEPFAQGHRGRSRELMGTGLGLAISKRLVHLMGGDMGVESQPGKGSLFWFTVRLQATTTEMDSLDISSWPETNMLIVLSHPFATETLSHLLHSWGIQHETCTTGQEALHKIAQGFQTEHPYSIVLCDDTLPDMTGQELSQSLQKLELHNTPTVILLTSYLERMQNSPVSDPQQSVHWLHKPIRQSQLYNQLHTLLFKKLSPTSEQMEDPGEDTSEMVLGRVLVVEDNPVNQKVALWLLKRLGYIADIAANGQIAVNMAKIYRYQAILMDCQMPVMNGYEATEKIREQEKDGEHTIIIAMTAEALRGEREHCLNVGMDDYISKPVDLHKLQEILEQWLQPHSKA